MSVDFSREAGAGLDTKDLPAYAPMLEAFHRACAAELRELVGRLPIEPGDWVLDMACGDGAYLPWLAEAVGPSGAVVGADLSEAYLARSAERELPTQVRLQQADIQSLPFEDAYFDGVWCAHSLYSLPDPLAALRELGRVVRPGGWVAILENDTLHHHLLPWPPELELALRQAQLRALEEQQQQASGKFYIGRNLCAAFALTGLDECSMHTATINHTAPLSADERLFLHEYLRDLGERAQPYLDAAARKAFTMLLDPESPLYLLDQQHFFASHLELLAIGRRPR